MSKNQNVDLGIEMLPALDVLDQMEQDSNRSQIVDENDNPPYEDPEEESEEGQEEGIVFDKSQDKKGKQAIAEADEMPAFQNELAIFAAQWKADGRLPADFEITEKLDEETLDKAVYDHKVKTLLDEKLSEHITKNGLTEDEINALRGKKFGVDSSLYNKQKAYNELSKLEFEAEDENGEVPKDYEKNVTDFLTLYYKDINYPVKKIEKSVEEDLASDDLNEIIAEAKKHFATKGKQIASEIKEKEAGALKQVDDKIISVVEKQKSYLKAKKIAGHQLSDEEAAFIERAIFQKTEIVTLKDGSSVKVSLYDKKLMETKTDPEKAFLTKALFVLQFHNGDTPVEKASKNILSQLRHVTKQTNSKKSNADIEILQ